MNQIETDEVEYLEDDTIQEKLDRADFQRDYEAGIPA